MHSPLNPIFRSSRDPPKTSGYRLVNNAGSHHSLSQCPREGIRGHKFRRRWESHYPGGSGSAVHRSNGPGTVSRVLLADGQNSWFRRTRGRCRAGTHFTTAGTTPIIGPRYFTRRVHRQNGRRVHPLVHHSERRGFSKISPAVPLRRRLQTARRRGATIHVT